MVCLDGIGRESERVELKGREFKKKVLTLPTILKINNGLNGYAPELVNGYRPEYVDHRNLDGCFLGVARAQEIFEGNLFLRCCFARNTL